MKRVFYLFSIILLATIITTACIRTYHTLAGYSHLPSGPITLLEIEEFNFNNIKDYAENGIPDMAFQYTRVYIKKQFDSAYTYVNTLNPYRETGMSFAERLSSLTQDIDIGDSISFDNYYYGTSESKKYARYFHKEQKYGVKSQNIAELIRKGNAFISTYPNPTIDKVKIQCDVANPIEAKYMLIDAAGRLVLEEIVADIREPKILNTTTYTAGVYYFYMVVDGELFTKKIIKY